MATTTLEKPFKAASYNHVVYDTLPQLDDAVRGLAAKGGLEHIKSCIRDVFMRHGMNEDFVLQLLHRHFDMTPDEKLVEYGPMQNPWPMSGKEDTIEGGQVLPKSWRVYDNELQPFEFKFIPSSRTLDSVSFARAFVEDLTEVLKAHDLIDLLGIALADEAGSAGPEDLIEITMGRNSIMVPLGPTTYQDSVPVVEAAWRFSNTAKDNAAMTARSCKGHTTPLDEMTTARSCKGHSTSFDGTTTARSCKGHSASLDGTDTARSCKGHSTSFDGTTTARSCKGHSAPLEGTDTARSCKGHTAALNGTIVTRSCKGHSAPLEGTDTARSCKGHSAAPVEGTITSRSCKGHSAAPVEGTVTARSCKGHSATPLEGTDTARSCKGHSATPLDGTVTTRSCKGHSAAPLEGTFTVRSCKGHSAPLDGTVAARSCKGHSLALSPFFEK